MDFSLLRRGTLVDLHNNIECVNTLADLILQENKRLLKVCRALNGDDPA